MAGVVKRADVKEDKDGKSRGMGTVTFEQPLEAVQAICILQNKSPDQKLEVETDPSHMAEEFGALPSCFSK